MRARTSASATRQCASRWSTRPTSRPESTRADADRDRHPARRRTRAHVGPRWAHDLAREVPPRPTGADADRRVWCVGVGGRPAWTILRLTTRPSSIAAGGVDHDVPCTGRRDPPPAARRLPPTPRPRPQAWRGRLRSRCSTSRSTISGRTGSRSARPVSQTVRLRRARHPSSTSDRKASGSRELASSSSPSIRPRPPVGQHLPRAVRRRRAGARSVLVFDVTELSRGAVLQVRDIVVE